MNTSITKLSILIVVLAITTGIKAQQNHDFFSIDNHDIVAVLDHASNVKLVTQVPDLSNLAIHYLEDTLEVVYGDKTFSIPSLFEEYESELLEDWMFEELIEPEEEIALEGWMFEELVEPEEETMLEDWMFEELTTPEEEITLEAWMFEELTAPEEEPTLEAWMFNTEYFNSTRN